MSYIMDCQKLHVLLGNLETPPGTCMTADTLSWYKMRITLRERIDRCRIALAPGYIRLLPPEILSEIFRYCLPESSRPDTLTAPLLLCCVSSVWRDVAHSTRDLWNHLDFTSQLQPGLRNFIQLAPSSGLSISPLHCWISHSQKSQLSLSFVNLDGHTLLDVISTVLLPHVADLFDLEIRLPLLIAHGPFQNFFSLPPHTLESLKFLTLTQGVPKAHVTVFQLAPRLTHLSLDGIDFAVNPYESGDIPTLQPTFPWPQITHLSIGQCLEFEVWLSVLSSCRSLQVGSFLIDLREDQEQRNSDEEDDDEVHICSHHQHIETDEPIVLPFLKELDIIVACGKSFSLQRFSFPELRALRFHRGHSPSYRLQGASPPDRFSWKASLPFVSGLGNLNLLSLVGNVGTVEEVIFLLSHVPRIDFLDLNIQVDHRQLCHALAKFSYHLQPHMVVPCLNHLRLTLEPGDAPPFTPDALAWVPLSRPVSNIYATKLESLTIISNTIQKQHMTRLRSMVDNARLYVPAILNYDPKSSRAVPRRRDIILWKT